VVELGVRTGLAAILEAAMASHCRVGGDGVEGGGGTAACPVERRVGAGF